MDDIKIQAAIITGCFTAVGWLVTHVLSIWKENKKRMIEAALNHTEKQLEHLYGPLTFHVLEGQQTFRDLLNKLGRNTVFESDKPLPKDEWETWMFWTENDLLPRNEKIKSLLMLNTHLLDQEEMPECYVNFLNHCNSWWIAHKRWKEANIDYCWHSNNKWPKEFDEHVLNTFKQIKRRHHMLILGLTGDKIVQPFK